MISLLLKTCQSRTSQMGLILNDKSHCCRKLVGCVMIPPKARKTLKKKVEIVLRRKDYAVKLVFIESNDFQNSTDLDFCSTSKQCKTFHKCALLLNFEFRAPNTIYLTRTSWPCTSSIGLNESLHIKEASSCSKFQDSTRLANFVLRFGLIISILLFIKTRC